MTVMTLTDIELACAIATFATTGLAGWILVRLLGVVSIAAQVVGAGVLATALIIVESELLSLFHVWTAEWLFISSVAALIVAGGLRYLRPRRRKAPSTPAQSMRERARCLRHPATLAWTALATAMLAITGAALAIEFWIGTQIAPNNWDSMTYHLSRIAYWMQYQHIGDYPGATVRQLGSLPNGEILQAFFMMPLRTDTFAFAAQWLALIGIGVCTYLGARLITRNRPAAILAGCAFCFLPQPVLQSTSTQNDLICAFFVLAGVVFALRGILRSHSGELLIGAIALAIAIGTKGTAWFVMPGLALAVAYLLSRGSATPRQIASLIGLTAVATLVVDGYWFAVNITNGRPIDGGVAGQTSTLSGAYGAKPDFVNVKSNLLRSIDITGLPPWPRDTLIRLVDQIAPAQVSMNLQAYPLEDLAAFGIAGLLLIPPVLVYGLAAFRARTSGHVFAIASTMTLLTFCFIVAANVWTGRLMIVIVALAAPLFTVAFRKWWLVVPVLIIVLVPGYRALTHNANKELLHVAGTLPLREAPRIIQMTQQRPEITGPLMALDQYAAPDAHIGYVGGEDDWDYPVFGPEFGRHITRIPAESATRDALASSALDGTFWALDGKTPPASLQPIPLGGKYFWVPGGK